MKATTAWILGILALAMVDVGVHWPTATIDVGFGLAPFDPARVDRVTLSRVDTSVVLERRGADWWLVGPGEGLADGKLVETLLAGLAPGVSLGLPLDSERDRYGLGNADVVTVRLDGEDVAATLYVGGDAPGGDTFVRLPERPDVFRAAIGGREAFARPASAWRDRTLVAGDPADVDQVVFHGLTFSRTGDGWRLEGPELPVGGTLDVDNARVDALIAVWVPSRGLERGEANAALLGDRLRLGFSDGPDVALGLSVRDGVGWVTRDDQGYRVSEAQVAAVSPQAWDWRAHQLIDVPPDAIRGWSWRGKGFDVHFSNATGVWRREDGALVQGLAPWIEAVSGLTVDERALSLGDALPERIELELASGDLLVIEVGGERVRVDGREGRWAAAARWRALLGLPEPR